MPNRGSKLGCLFKAAGTDAIGLEWEVFSWNLRPALVKGENNFFLANLQQEKQRSWLSVPFLVADDLREI